jgi:hypothetical protein
MIGKSEKLKKAEKDRFIIFIERLKRLSDKEKMSYTVKSCKYIKELSIITSTL